MKKTSDPKHQVAHAIAACQDKKADKVSVLELDKASGAFTDFFVICSGSNPRQIQAISDEVEQRLAKEAGVKATNVEGYKQAEWVLLDYVDFVVHIFAEKARDYYDLERLWRSAKKLDPAELKTPKKRASAKRASAATGPKPARPRKRAPKQA